MAKDPFAEMAGQQSGARKPFNLSRVVASIAVIGALTVGFAFYMPLNTAHSALAKEHETLAASNSGTNSQLSKTTDELTATQKERDELAAKLKTIDEDKETKASAISELKSSIESSLKTPIKANQVTVAEKDGAVTILIDNLRVFRGHQVTAHPPGKRLLCSVAAALKGKKLDVEVAGHTIDKDVTNPLLRKDFLTVWDASAARAVGALRVLESCGVDGKNMRAVGAANHRLEAELAKQSDGATIITVRPN